MSPGRGASAPTGSPPSAEDPFIAGLVARCEFPPAGTEVTCAVSGGADSTALLALSLAAGLVVRVVHVDHGLRHGSGADAQHVVELCRTWGVPVQVVEVHLSDGPDLEARARAARQAALPPGTLHGHTADDQAETVVLRLLRGTGPHGLAAMSTDTHPMLALRRADTVDVCAHLGVPPRHDPTNEQPRFTRNRVRHEVLPLLADVAGRDVVPLLARLAELSARQLAALEEVSSALDPTDASAVAAAPSSVAAAALRSWWCATTGEQHPPDRAALERVLAVAAGDTRSCDVCGGWRVARTAGRLRLEHVDRAEVRDRAEPPAAHGVPPRVQG